MDCPSRVTGSDRALQSGASGMAAAVGRWETAVLAGRRCARMRLAWHVNVPRGTPTLRGGMVGDYAVRGDDGAPQHWKGVVGVAEESLGFPDVDEVLRSVPPTSTYTLSNNSLCVPLISLSQWSVALRSIDRVA